MRERLQKLISQAGLASRRAAETMITEGRVKVNGKVVSELGQKADLTRDTIIVDGKKIEREPLQYFLFNKPKGGITTLSDPEGRTTVLEYFKKEKVRLYPVGRLDLNTEGLLLLTNDGDLTNRLEHPSSEVEKEYEIKIKGRVPDKMLTAFREGVPLEDGITAPAKVSEAVFDVKTGLSTIVLTIHEGRNRQVRRMCEHFGFRVHNLKRTRYATLTLQGVKRGSYRALTANEISDLKAQVTHA